jgi:glycosyltransferase involved in cell wall biosynthesis
MAIPPASSTDGPDGKGARLWFVAALPPPLNGQSNCNRAMLAELTARGATICCHDIGGPPLSKLRGIARALLAIMACARHGEQAYLSVPGQSGVWLFVPLALLLRLRGLTHYVHHHSFRPINLGPLRGMRMLVAAGGRRQRHILLSTDMRRRFANLYLEGDDRRALSLSNAYLFGPQLGVAERPDRPVTLGHMSVLTQEKGVAYLLALFATLIARGHDWRLVIAGPCADPDLRAALDTAVAVHHGRVAYRGAIDGADKERFFADIDLFVLPTTLIDEAEPLVMLEAFGRGVDVVANDTGCIRDRIRDSRRLLTRDREGDATLIAARIADNAADWSAARHACVAHARDIKVEADGEAAVVFPQLLSSELPGSGCGFAIDARHVT